MFNSFIKRNTAFVKQNGVFPRLHSMESMDHYEMHIVFIQT